MSLTAYVLERVLAGIFFNWYCVGLYGHLGAAGCLLIALSIFTLTHAFASLWLQRYADGLLEFILRAITRFGDGRAEGL